MSKHPICHCNRCDNSQRITCDDFIQQFDFLLAVINTSMFYHTQADNLILCLAMRLLYQVPRVSRARKKFYFIKTLFLLYTPTISLPSKPNIPIQLINASETNDTDKTKHAEALIQLKQIILTISYKFCQHSGVRFYAPEAQVPFYVH